MPFNVIADSTAERESEDQQTIRLRFEVSVVQSGVVRERETIWLRFAATFCGTFARCLRASDLSLSAAETSSLPVCLPACLPFCRPLGQQQSRLFLHSEF